MSKTSLNILINKYTAGKISREEFLYFHALLSRQNLGNQPVDAEAIINAARQPSPAPDFATQTQQRPAAAGYGQIDLDVDFHDSPSPRSMHVKPAFSKASFKTPSFSTPSFSKAPLIQFATQHYKQVAAVIGVVGLMSTFVSNYFFTAPESGNASIVKTRILDDSDTEESAADAKRQDQVADMESVAHSLIDKRPWNRNDVNDFIKKWNNLSPNEKRDAKDTGWYRKFSLALTSNLAQQSALANDGNISAVYLERALSKLTDALKSNNNNKTRVAANETSRTRDTSADDADSAFEDESTTSSNSAPRKPTRKPAKAVAKIKRTEIKDLVDQYVYAYEMGKISTIARLFKDNRHSGKRYKNDTLNEYQTVFANTKARSVEIDDLEWDINADSAEGDGRYSSILKLSNNNRKEVSADIHFTISKRDNAVLIDSVRLANLKATSIPVKTTTAKSRSSNTDSAERKTTTISSRKPFVDNKMENRRVLVGSAEYKATYASNARPKLTKRKPSKEELNDLVARYVDTYQEGDANEIITLFSGSTWTHDRTGILQMRQDYQDIFSNTSARKMSIKNLRWKFKKNKAMGTGNLTLSSVSKDPDSDQENRTEKKGKIRLVVELRDEEALISHLYQIFN